ncbi:hypothetical protein DD630_33190 [Streptomyces sp. BSE7F]|nr:hypothetical protein DD630_33190 [Streptomyces sp. BSE7F]
MRQLAPDLRTSSRDNRGTRSTRPHRPPTAEQDDRTRINTTRHSAPQHQPEPHQTRNEDRSMSARRIHFHNVIGWTPKSVATCSTVTIKAVLSAFVAGTVLRLADPDAETRHPHFHTTLNGIGYSFLVPVFFITSGIQFDLVAALRRRNHRPTGAAPPHGPAARPRTSRTDSPQGGPLTRATRRRRTPAGHDPRP